MQNDLINIFCEIKVVTGIPRCANSRMLRAAAHASGSALVSQKALIKSFCKSQLPHKFVNKFFILVIVQDQLTDQCGN